MHLDFISIVRDAWKNYDDSREVDTVDDISVKVSTNHVFRLKIEDGTVVIAKVSYFGSFEMFVEDHALINALSINLPDPYQNVLSRSLQRKNQLFVHRHQEHLLDAWVVFYNPIKVDQTLPKILSFDQISELGIELARFHKSCSSLLNVLPDWSKSLETDTKHLLSILETETGQYEHRGNLEVIQKQCDVFFENSEKLQVSNMKQIPVFVDWNIGNFSVTTNNQLYSRWDYDWFRMGSRVLDFYFWSRVCRKDGDQTAFSYLIEPLMEERFLIFLKAYHSEFPLSYNEILFLKEAYRFFILNYVIKDGKYFFHEIYNIRLQKEAFEIYIPNLDNSFKPEVIAEKLKL